MKVSALWYLWPGNINNYDQLLCTCSREGTILDRVIVQNICCCFSTGILSEGDILTTFLTMYLDTWLFLTSKILEKWSNGLSHILANKFRVVLLLSLSMPPPPTTEQWGFQVMFQNNEAS